LFSNTKIILKHYQLFFVHPVVSHSLSDIQKHFISSQEV